MYIMKVKDVQNGIIQPLHKNEVEQMESFEGYADYTQALCDNATIIHYIGESKPWDAARPDAGTYRIFDRYYLEYAAHVKDR
jgi:lipopolysaccharide biosynthesis glycosyltransferase